MGHHRGLSAGNGVVVVGVFQKQKNEANEWPCGRKNGGGNGYWHADLLRFLLPPASVSELMSEVNPALGHFCRASVYVSVI